MPWGPSNSYYNKRRPVDSARPRSLSIYRVRRHCVMDPAWIHDGSDVSDFTKPYVFTGILLGSTMVPRWLPCWDMGGTICFHWDPAWIHDGSDLALSTKPYVFKWILLGSTMVPGWLPCWDLGGTECFHRDPSCIHDGSHLPRSTKPYVITRILLGSMRDPRWFPCWELGETTGSHTGSTIESNFRTCLKRAPK